MSLELRIIDDERGGIRARLVADGAAHDLALPLEAPQVTGLRQLVGSYFSRARADRADDGAFLAGSERALLEMGFALGEQLLGRNGQLAAFAACVRDRGVSTLRIAIQSDRPSFHAEPWELLVLPQTKVVASAACRGFVRAGSDGSREPASACESLEYDASAPLRALRVCVRKAGNEALAGKARAIAWQHGLHAQYAALRADVLVDPSWQAFVRELAKSYPIVHFDGPILMRRGRALLAFPDAEIDVQTFAETLAAQGTSLLVLDPLWRGNDSESGISAVALAALGAGIRNVVALAWPVDARSSEECLLALYGQLAQGRSVETAAVECRKDLQRRFLERAAAAAEGRMARPLQAWSGLLHFGTQDVLFRYAGATPWELDRGAWIRQARTRMFGFCDQHLRVDVEVEVEVSSASAQELVGALQNRRQVVLCGERGMGATYAVHRAALQLVCAERVSVAFRWDFRDELYSGRDLCQMTASALQLPAPADATPDQVFAALAEPPALLAFENLDRLVEAAVTESADAALSFVRRALQEGLPCILTASSWPAAEALQRALALPALTLQGLVPLTLPEVVALAERLSPQLAGDPAACRRVHELTRGNAFEVQKLLALAAHQPLEELARDWSGSRLQTPADDPVSRFHAWRWSCLDPSAQRLLACFAPFGEALVEMWTAALDASGAGTTLRQRLWAGLEIPAQMSFRDVMQRWKSAGFLLQRLDGHVLDPLLRPFLCEARVALQLSDELETLFSALVCDTVSALSKHLLRQPHEGIRGSLIANRSIWWDHFERIWQTAAPQAVRALLPFEQLLRQAGLAAEVPYLCLSLIQSRAPQRMCEDTSDDLALAWLVIARKALEAQGHGGSEPLRWGAHYWRDRFLDSAWRAGCSEELTRLTLTFLQAALQHPEHVRDYRAVCAAACDYARQRGDQVLLRHHLKALAACEHELADASACRSVEEQLLRDGSPEIALEVATTRLRRGDVDGASELLERLEDCNDETVVWPRQLLLADVEIARGQAESALQRLCPLWTQTTNRQRGPLFQQLIWLLQRIHRELGSARFTELYREHVQDFPSPLELGLMPSSSGALELAST